MSINNITQTISTIPEAGRRGVDVQTVFVNKQEDFQDHLADITIDELNTLKDQLNTRIGEINSTTTTMNGYADTASAGASTATTKAGEASTSASEALTSRNQASTFATNSSNSATKASQWADNNYNVAVETGKYSAKHWATEAQNVVSGKVDKVMSTDKAITRFNGAAGYVQDSKVFIDDAGNIYANGSEIDLMGTDNTNYKQLLCNPNTDNPLSPRAMFTVCGSTFTGAYQTTKAGYASLYAANADIAINADGAKTVQVWTNSTERMRIDANGNLLVGIVGGSRHVLTKATGATFSGHTDFTSDNGSVAVIVGGTFIASANNVGNSTLGLGKNLDNSRSIEATGTINASGADYAEYEYSNDINLIKGQIVGFKVDGTLTDRHNEAIRFAIKSTNPSIVGGDTWGAEDVVGKRPEQPVRKVDKTEQVQIEGSEEFETVVIEAGDTDAEWETIEAQYKIDLADFEARLEAERQKVDRIAYAGKVPVNVYGATAGQYIVAIEKDGVIDGLAVNKADMTFAQYQDAVGRVNKILDDGRAEVAIIIH